MARSRIALGLAVLLTVNAVYTHAAAVVAHRELLQAPVGGASGPLDVTFQVLPPVPVADRDFFEVLDFTNVPEQSITSSPTSAGPVPEVALDLPPEAALGPQTFSDPGSNKAYDTIEDASKTIQDTANYMKAINNPASTIDTNFKDALAAAPNAAPLAAMTRLVSTFTTDNQEFAQEIQNVAAQWEAVIRSAASPPTQVGPWVELPSNPAADPTGLNQLQLWQYNYNTLVLPAQTALADYLANPGDSRYLHAFIAVAGTISGSGAHGQMWSVSLAASALLSDMAVATNPAGSCAADLVINQAADGATMCMYQNSAGLGALLEYDRHNYTFVAQYLFSTALVTLNVAAACEGAINAIQSSGDESSYQLNIATYQSWYQLTLKHIYAYYVDMATYFWNNQFRVDVAAAMNLGIGGSISSAAVTQDLLGALNQKYNFLVWNGFVFTAPGLYTPVTGQVWAQVGGCMAGRVGIDTLWLPFNPTTCSTAGGSIYYPNYPLSNGTNVGYMLFWNSAGETTPLPGDNAKITGIAQGCQGSTPGDPKSIADCVSAAYPNRGIIALNPGNNVPDPSAYAAGSYAGYIFYSNLPASGNDASGTTLALLPPP